MRVFRHFQLFFLVFVFPVFCPIIIPIKLAYLLELLHQNLRLNPRKSNLNKFSVPLKLLFHLYNLFSQLLDQIRHFFPRVLYVHLAIILDMLGPLGEF